MKYILYTCYAGTLNVSIYSVVIANTGGTPVQIQSRWLFGAIAQVITFSNNVATSPASVVGNVIVEKQYQVLHNLISKPT